MVVLNRLNLVLEYYCSILLRILHVDLQLAVVMAVVLEYILVAATPAYGGSKFDAF